ncbi:MAG: DNA cytosine methyltransferase [Solirubrobacteraceae bacterium]|nr:DNA cytosine methyltransferase [Solirubrobacteraceae bacterium]
MRRPTDVIHDVFGPWAGGRSGTGLRVLSLYSGAGGLDRGFVDLGYEISHAVEVDRHAAATYRENLGDHVVEGELPAVLRSRSKSGARSTLRPDVIIGGPPCQGFSVIGRMDPADPRSKHVHAFLDVVDTYRPAAFCMENVSSLATSPRWRGVYARLIRRAETLGYRVTPMVLNAADYTVPQARKRLFLVGARGLTVSPPGGPRLGGPVTVLEALRQLPAYGAVGNDTLCRARVVLAKKPVMRPSPYKGSLLFNGSGRPLELDAVARTLPASMGGNGTPILDQYELAARLANPDAHVESWVVTHHARLMAGKVDEPSGHPLRRITLEEAAALQSFPPDWTWAGPTNARFRQVGNAVPPRLARYVAQAVAEALTSPDDRPVDPASRRIQPMARRRRAAPALSGIPAPGTA